MTASFVEENDRERARLRAFVEGLSDQDLRRAANPDWTVAGVLAHMAFWDARALVLGRKLQRGAPFTSDDEEPEDADWINDSTKPVIEALEPRAAAELAVRIAEETDSLMASLPPDRLWPEDPASPINPLRADHRAEHLDELEATVPSTA